MQLWPNSDPPATSPAAAVQQQRDMKTSRVSVVNTGMWKFVYLWKLSSGAMELLTIGYFGETKTDFEF